MDSIHLIGAEDVRAAGSRMASAAEEMRSAAGTMDGAAREIRNALQEHQQFLTSFLEQFQEIIVAGNQKRISQVRVEDLREVHTGLMAMLGRGDAMDRHTLAEILKTEDELTARGHPLAFSDTYAGSVAAATRNAR